MAVRSGQERLVGVPIMRDSAIFSRHWTISLASRIMPPYRRRRPMEVVPRVRLQHPLRVRIRESAALIEVT
jgi:hypothetical protein